MLRDETSPEILPRPLLAAALGHRAALELVIVIDQHTPLIEVVAILIFVELLVMVVFGLVAGRENDLKAASCECLGWCVVRCCANCWFNFVAYLDPRYRKRLIESALSNRLK